VVPDSQPDGRLKVNHHDLKIVAWISGVVVGRLKVNHHDLKIVACERRFRHALSCSTVSASVKMEWPSALAWQPPSAASSTRKIISFFTGSASVLKVHVIFVICRVKGYHLPAK
jgi:hypothetical protein